MALSWGFCSVPQSTHSLNFGGHGTEKVIHGFPANNSPAGPLLVSHLHQQVLNLSSEFCLPLLFSPYPRSLYSSIYPVVPILHSSLLRFLLRFSLHIFFIKIFLPVALRLTDCEIVKKFTSWLTKHGGQLGHGRAAITQLSLFQQVVKHLPAHFCPPPYDFVFSLLASLHHCLNLIQKSSFAVAVKW